MHSTSCQDGNMLIIGGRNERGVILSDVWVLRFIRNSSSILPSAGADADAGQQTIIESCESNENKTRPVDLDLNSSARQIDALELARATSAHEISGPEALPRDREGGNVFEGRIQELDLSASEQIWQKKEPPTPPSALLPLTNLHRNSLCWTLVRNLILPVGRCAHSSTVSEGDIFVCGGFTSEGGITDVMLCGSMPLHQALQSGSTNVSKSDDLEPLSCVEGDSGVAQWRPITLETAGAPTPHTAIGSRFGHSMCAVSAGTCALIHKTSRCTGSESDSREQQLGKNIDNDLNSASRRSFMIFGGVSAEKDFSDMWLVTGGSQTS